MASIYKQKRSRFWWIKYRDSAGNLTRRSLRTPHRGVARECKFQLESQLKSPARPGDLESTVADFLATVRAARNAGHYHNIRGRLRLFLDRKRIRRFPDISAAAIQSFCNDLTAAGLAPRTVRGYCQSIRSFCSYLRSMGLLESDPCQNISLPRPEKLPPKFLTLYECKRALVIARRESDFLFRVVASYLLTGCRRNEIRFLSWPDLTWPAPGDRNSGRITIRRGKGSKFRVIPFHPLLVDILTAARPEPPAPNRRLQGPVFPGVKGSFMGPKQWNSLLRPLQSRLAAFGRHWPSGYHILRYTFGSLYVTAGGDIYRLSKILGHSSVATTQRTYAHLQDSPDPVFARYHDLPPR